MRSSSSIPSQSQTSRSLSRRRQEILEAQAQLAPGRHPGEEALDVLVADEPEQLRLLAGRERAVEAQELVQADVDVGLHRGRGVAHQMDVARAVEELLGARERRGVEGVGGRLVDQRAAAAPLPQPAVELLGGQVPLLQLRHQRAGARRVAAPELHHRPQQPLAREGVAAGEVGRALPAGSRRPAAPAPAARRAAAGRRASPAAGSSPSAAARGRRRPRGAWRRRGGRSAGLPRPRPPSGGGRGSRKRRCPSPPRRRPLPPAPPPRRGVRPGGRGRPGSGAPGRGSARRWSAPERAPSRARSRRDRAAAGW